jgi:glutamate--cysteine ligase
VASRYRTLDADALREVVARELFDWGRPGSEGYALSLEALPAEWPARGPRATWARQVGPAPAVPAPERLEQALAGAARAIDLPLHPAGRWAPRPAPGPWVEVGPGGQVLVRSGWQGTPAEAGSRATGALDALRCALLGQGLDLLALGRDPWHGPEARAFAGCGPWSALEERGMRAAGGRGLEALRSTAGCEVRVGFGGPVKGPRRWRAAWLLVPRLAALFAHSPLEDGTSARCKSARGRAWLHADPTRCGIPPAVLEDPAMAPHDQYTRFALGARVLWTVRDGQVYEPQRPLSFAQWMSAGDDGWFPELDDWRAHLAGLRSPVRPEGALVIEAADAQGRAFAALPLLVAAALLADDAATEEVLQRLGGSASELDGLQVAATSDGLLDPALARESRELLALVADALLRAPGGWAAPEQVAALVAFEQELTRGGRTPADALLEVFLEHGALGRDQLEQLEERWCAAAGTPVSWRPARPA